MRQVECKICRSTSGVFAAVDFLKHCNKQIQEANAPSGIEVKYYRCSECEFVFYEFY